MKVIFIMMLLTVLSPLGADAKQGVCHEGNCENGHGTFEYTTGMKYTGYWFKGLEHGKGKMIMEIGTTYEGDYRGGKPHGVGEFILPDGRSYIGEWQDGKPEGKGKESHPIGTSYVGKWHKGMPHGFGTRMDSGKIVDQGYWIEGQFVGTEKPKELN